MKSYKSLDKKTATAELQKLQDEYSGYLRQGLKLDMSRGKPGADELDLSCDFADMLSSDNISPQKGEVDCRNYGVPEGIKEARELMADVLDANPEEIYIGMNSSLSLMYDVISYAYIFGLPDSAQPWCCEDNLKFLCPSPGYDRHFAITQKFGFELIPIEMKSDGPDMAAVEEYVKDPAVKGIWNVPKYSNPTGITYSDEVVRRFAALKPAAADFLTMWDNAYVVHHLNGDKPETLLPLLDEAKKQGSENMVFMFTSSAKMLFPGSGISVLATSKRNLKWYLGHKAIQTICTDKMMQLAVTKYFRDKNSLNAHMAILAKSLKPKFDTVIQNLEKIAEVDIASWNVPNGGYFISVDVLDGCAKRVVQLCGEAGVVLTGAGATFPYGKDPRDRNIRFAPSFPTVQDLEVASRLFCLCIKIAALEQIIK